MTAKELLHYVFPWETEPGVEDYEYLLERLVRTNEDS